MWSLHLVLVALHGQFTIDIEQDEIELLVLNTISIQYVVYHPEANKLINELFLLKECRPRNQWTLNPNP